MHSGIHAEFVMTQKVTIALTRILAVHSVATCCTVTERRTRNEKNRQQSAAAASSVRCPKASG